MYYLTTVIGEFFHPRSKLRGIQINSEIEKQSKLQMRMSKFDKNLVGFLIIRTETNLITAIGIVIVFFIGGIDFAILWGVLIFLLSYIPFIGLFLASIPPAMLALFKYGPVGALAVIVMILVINMLAENVIFPSLAGKGLKLSPGILFLSLIIGIMCLELQVRCFSYRSQ